MPTPKQVRFHFKRIARYHDLLQTALNQAHNAGVIKYDDFQEQSPCYLHYKTWERILATTEKQLAAAMRSEIWKS